VTQTCRDDDSGCYASAAGLGNSLGHCRGRHRDDDKVGRLSDRLHGFHGRKALDFNMVRVDHMNGAGKSAGKDICDDVSPDGTFVWACAYDGE
jgi:hypothetical protein